MRKVIESLLWSYGLSPNYTGFAYLADVLELAEKGYLICANTITLAAQAREISRSRFYQSLALAVNRMDLPRSYPGPTQDRLYQKMNFLHQCLLLSHGDKKAAEP